MLFRSVVWPRALLSAPEPNAFQFGVAAVLFLLATLIVFKNPLPLREKLKRELRDIACAPIPPRGDKRFKRWDPKLIFPPGRWGELVLHEAKPNRLRPRR